jgi:tetratricopeptide (TPR) repeat protein
MDHNLEEILEYALRISQKIERPVSRTAALLDIAGVWCDAGQFSRCREILGLAIQKADTIKRPEEKASLLANTGGIFVETGDEVKARELFQRAVLLARATETARQRIDVLHTAGLVSAEAGLKEESVQIVSELYQTVISGEKADDVVADLVDIADVYYVLDQKEKAGDILAEAQSKAGEIKDDWLKAERLTDIIEELIFTGLTEKAARILEENILDINRIEFNRPYFLLKISGFYISLGEKSKAREILNRALEIVKEDELAYSRSHDLIELASHYLQMEEPSKAFVLVNEAKDLISTIEDNRDHVEGLIQLSVILGKMGETEQSLEAADQAAGLCKTIGDARSRLYLLGRILVLYFKKHEHVRSNNILDEIIQITRGKKLHTGGLSSLVEELTETGELAAGLRLICLINEPESKVRALTAIIPKLLDLKPGLSSEVSQAIQTCLESNGV